MDELWREYDAVLLAVGALQGRDLPVPGRDLDGIHLAMEYLVQQNRRVAGDAIDADPISTAGKRVVILGGGDTSADCLGNALREDAAAVQVLTHGPRPPDSPQPLEWPDWPFVLRTYPAHEEGGERDWSVTVTGFSGDRGVVERMHVVRTQRDADGVTRAIPGTETAIETDLVLLAIGFEGPVRDGLCERLGVEMTPNGAVASHGRYATTAPGVWVAGDAHRGASLIVWAIAEGRNAAREIDRALVGASRLPA